MPYAALNPDCHVLTAPTRADIERTCADTSRRGLIVFDFPFASLEAFASCQALEILKIQGARALTTLDGADALSGLREFVLTTPTGSDGSGRSIDVASLAPLERLGQLERLILLNVRPLDGEVSAIARMAQLRDIDIGGVCGLTLDDFARLRVALPAASGRCLAPYTVIPGVGRCRRCQGQEVLLNATPPRARKWVCPACSPKLLQAHQARWDAAVATAGRAATLPAR